MKRKMVSKIMPRIGLVVLTIALISTDSSSGKSAKKIADLVQKVVSAVAGGASVATSAYLIFDPITKAEVSLPEKYQDMEKLLYELEAGYEKHEQLKDLINDNKLLIELICNIISLFCCIVSLILAILKSRKRRNERMKKEAKGSTTSANTTTTVV